MSSVTCHSCGHEIDLDDAANELVAEYVEHSAHVEAELRAAQERAETAERERDENREHAERWMRQSHHFMDLGNQHLMQAETAEATVAQQAATIARLAEKIKRLQGELSHDQHCQADEISELDVDHCNTCLTLADFGITEADLAADPPAALVSAERGGEGS